jgi:ankyrin repeat protein
LIQHGADVNARSNPGYTPLHLAVTNLCVETVKLLLENGADPKIRDDSGKTALDWALPFKIKEIAEIISKYMNQQSKNR